MKQIFNKLKNINETLLAGIVVLIVVIVVFSIYGSKKDDSFGFKCSDFETPEKYTDSLAKWIHDYLEKYPQATAEDMMVVRDKLIEENKCERPNFTLSDEESVLPKLVYWEGKVIAKLTYGRLRLSKLVIDDQYSQFIAEPTDIVEDGPWSDSPTTKNIKVGDIISIAGEWESTDRGILPWVIIEKIETNHNKFYTFKNLGFSFEMPENYYSLISTEDEETIYIAPIEFSSDNKEGIVIAARKTSPDFSALDWLKGENSGYELSNGYKTTKIDGQEAYLLYWRNPNIIDGVLLNNPDKTRQITISILGDIYNKSLKEKLNKIISTFSFN